MFLLDHIETELLQVLSTERVRKDTGSSKCADSTPHGAVRPHAGRVVQPLKPRIRILVTLLLFFIVCCDAASASENSAKRVALVIGNSAYEHVTALPNPKNDAKEVAAKLKALGFEVTLLNDASYNDLREALAELSNAAVGAEIGAVFFAGHGIEVDRQNYLIPVDAKLESDLRVHFEAMPLDDLMRALEGVVGVRLVMLDACRNNPFISSMKIKTANRSISRGLSKVEPSVGSLVSFSAKEGTTAADGIGKHSPYTRALLDNLDKPGVEINRLFRIVRDEVLASTGGEQEPYTYGSTSSAEIFLKESAMEPPKSVITPAPAISTADAILSDFQLAKDVGTKEAWEAFLETHGKVKGNFYVNLAVASLQKMQSPQLPKAEDTAEEPSSASTNKEQLAPTTDKKPASIFEKQSTPAKKESQPITKTKTKTAALAPEPKAEKNKLVKKETVTPSTTGQCPSNASAAYASMKGKPWVGNTTVVFKHPCGKRMGCYASGRRTLCTWRG